MASSLVVVRYVRMSSGKLVGSGVSDSSGATVSIGLDQGGIVCPGSGLSKRLVRSSYRCSMLSSTYTVPDG